MRSIAFALVLLVFSGVANSHGGGLDRYGCHNDRKRGGYHCHRAPAQAALPPSQHLYAPAPLPQRSQASGQETRVPSTSAVSPSPQSLLSGNGTTGSSSGSIEDQTGGRVVRGAVWKYAGPDGKVHYTNIRPDSYESQLLFTYVESSGQMWRVVFSAGDGTEAAVHSQSVTRDGTFASGWVLFNYADVRRTAQGAVKSQAEKWSVDCSQQRLSKSDTVSYAGTFATGAVVQSWSGYSGYQGAVPGSSGDALVRALCFDSLEGNQP